MPPSSPFFKTGDYGIPCIYVTEMLLLLFSPILLLWDPMNCSPPGSSVHGIFQARIQSGPFSSPGDLADPEIQPTFVLLVHSLPLSHLRGISETFSSVQFSSVAQSCPTATPWITARQASLSITSSRSSLKLTSIESVMPSSHLILCRPLLLLPPIPPSIRVFSNESTLCMNWSKYWSFSFSISPFKEHQGLISFRMDWLDLLAVQGILKSLLQHNSSKASILCCSAFFTV